MKKILFWMVFLSLGITTHMNAQGWERALGSLYFDNQSRSITQLNDLGYIVGGWTYGTDTVFGEPGDYVIRLDKHGNTLWEYTNNQSLYTQTHDIIPTSDQGFIATSSYGGAPRIFKLNSSGTLEWEKLPFSSLGPLSGKAIVESEDGGYVFTGKVNMGGGNIDIYVYKIDQNGDSVWFQTYGTSGVETGLDLIRVSDGYVIGGEYTSLGTPKANLLKIDFDGNELWQHQYGSQITGASALAELSDGSIVACGSFIDSTFNLWMLKTDAMGIELSSKTFLENVTNQGMNLAVTQNDAVYALVKKFSFTTGIDAEVVKMDDSFNMLWSKSYGGISSDVGYGICATMGEGFAATGKTSSFGFNNEQSYILAADQDGNTFTNSISGNVYHDLNVDCIKDAAEEGLYTTGSARWMVKVTPGPLGTDAYYATTDENGNYEIECEINTYTIAALPVTSQWNSTCANQTVTFSNPLERSTDNDFGFTIVENCEHLVVDIASTRVRQCRTAVYYVNYCNNGTSDASNTSIEVELPSEFTFSSSSLTESSSNGSTYIFDIGTLNSGDCGSFTISGDVSCSVVNGQALCASAEISPNVGCAVPNLSWDRSSMSVNGSCVNDTAICFTITNSGSGNMTFSGPWRLYANNELVQTGAFQLNAGATKDLCFEATGATLRLEVDQPANHPGNSQPRASVELCGTGDKDLGYILQVPQDDLDDHVEISCTEVTSSFDPNDKRAVPAGITDQNYISQSVELEYTIRFQNTGNDTAFNIFIIDTLDQDVCDISSLRMLSASHGFVLEISNAGIAQWTFTDIYLPDSNINEPMSHGFVKFKLNQSPTNMKGTQIENNAFIYFDFNEAVETNRTLNTVHDTILEGDPVLQLGVAASVNNGIDEMSVIVSPNPFNTSTTFHINGGQNLAKMALGDWKILIYDNQGTLVHSDKMVSKSYLFTPNSDLSSGIYHYQIIQKNTRVVTGKVIINE